MNTLDPTDLGPIVDLTGAAITGSAQNFGFAAGNPNRVVFFAHAEFDGATNLTGYDLKLYTSYDNTTFAEVALRKAFDDSRASPQQILAAAGATQDVAYYAENLRGARHARLVVTGQGGAAKAGDKLKINGAFW